MVIKPEVLARIRKIIDKWHKYTLITMIGQNNVPRELLEELRRDGLTPEHAKSFLQMAYNHNYLNDFGVKENPKTHREMVVQQIPSSLPNGTQHASSLDFLTQNLKALIEKQKAEVTSRIEGMIQDENNKFKFETMKNPEGSKDLNEMMLKVSKSKLVTRFRDASKDSNRNWDRIVHTEISNAISLGSADRIIDNNKGTNPEEIYVYRIVVEDSALCKWCRKFYMDSDGSPKLYKLSELLSNGSNYGKRTSEWKPVALATHPNERCSPVIELKRGFKALKGGAQTFIGYDEWPSYIQSKI